LGCIASPLTGQTPAKAAVPVAEPFALPPEGVAYFLHRKTQDVNPPRAGKVLYRLQAQSAEGTQNRSGEGQEFLIP
jgi:hypothetical protein